MKVILSRKGFDSGYGGYPSIILSSGEMITLPIPCSEDNVNYSEVKNGNSTLFDLMSKIKTTVKCGKTYNLTPDTKCHLDPDLAYKSRYRKEGWRGAFGQIGAAQSVLANNNVKEGDLFIFFGWFNNLKESEGNYKFEKSDGKHTMFGFLQIDKIIYPGKEEVPEWLKEHPHANNYRRLGSNSNCIYIAKERCTFNKSIKGYGMFKYNKELDLTKKGMSRTKWELPEIFKNVSMTYHTKDSFKADYFKSACRGQEFVIEENKDIEKWAISLIEKYALREK